MLPLGSGIARMSRQAPSAHTERIVGQARNHARVRGHDYRTIFGPHEWWADEPLIGPLEEFLTRHPMSAASKEMVALHEAGHSITFERLGMWMAFAHIHGSAFGHYGWSGGASARNSVVWDPRPETWDLAAFRGEARSALAGPIAEELLGGGDALGSIGELAGARCWAERVAELEGREEHEVVREVVISATSLVERYEGDIRDLADVLARRKRISRFDCPVKKNPRAGAAGPALRRAALRGRSSSLRQDPGRIRRVGLSCPAGPDGGR